MSLGLRRERSRPQPEEAVALGGEPLHQPDGSLLHTSILGQAPSELLRRLFGLELTELGGFVREERACLQLEQRRDQHEELATHLEIELVPLGHELDEREDDDGDVDFAGLELLLQQKRQEQIERAFERVEVEVELTHRGRGHGRRLARAPDAAFVSEATRPVRALRPRKVPFKPIRDPVGLPDEHVACQARALLDHIAALVDKQNDVR